MDAVCVGILVADIFASPIDSVPKPGELKTTAGFLLGAGGCATNTAACLRRLGRSVTIDQAAQLLNVSRRTIYYRIRDGRLQTIRTIGGSQRVLVESLYNLGFRPQAFSTSASAASFGVRPSRG